MITLQGLASIPPHTQSVFRTLHLSDLHLGKPREHDSREVFNLWLDAIQPISADLLILSGDLVETPGDEKRLREVHAALERARIAYVVVPGNHDIARPEDLKLFEELFGSFPRVEEHAGWRIALFDSLSDLPLSARSPEELDQLKELGFLSDGAISPESLAAVTPKLAPPWLAVVHHHLEMPEGSSRQLNPLTNASDLLDWAQRLGCRGIFHGHWHDPIEIYTRREIPIFSGSASTKLGGIGRVVDFGAGGWKSHSIAVAQG